MLRLRELRKKKHFTQIKVAMDLNMTSQCLSYYETGKREPSIATLKMMARYFKVTVDYLVGMDLDD